VLNFCSLSRQSPTATVAKVVHSPGNGHNNSPGAALRARRLTQPADDAKQVPSPARLALLREQQRDQRDQYSPGQGAAAAGAGAGAPDTKYQALLDNVSMHLEAARKDADAVAGGTQGVSKGPARNRNGGALKKLNKRYSSPYSHVCAASPRRCIFLRISAL
jgi:hypothetical protein